MKNLIFKTGLYFLFFCLLVIIQLPFQGCKPDDPEEEECTECIIAYKPNIYLYPTEKSSLNVNLSFPMGGRVITSFPEYNSGWNVTVDSNGLINNKYGYLFYESIQPDVWQTEEGWIINRSELAGFFADDMQNRGFNGKEIRDFLDYWIPELSGFENCIIYPQESGIIEKVIKLEISILPENVLRFFYLIEGFNGQTNKNVKTPEPPVPVSRTGFHVAEWGVVLK